MQQISIRSLRIHDLLHPIDQFGRLTNRPTLCVPIGQCPHNWSISTILTNSTKTNVLFCQLDQISSSGSPSPGTPLLRYRRHLPKGLKWLLLYVKAGLWEQSELDKRKCLSFSTIFAQVTYIYHPIPILVSLPASIPILSLYPKMDLLSSPPHSRYYMPSSPPLEPNGTECWPENL